MRLYELTDEIRFLDKTEPENIKDELAKITGEFKKKAVNVAKYWMELNADIDSIDTEIQRLQVHRKSICSKEDAIKSYLMENMITAGIDKIDDPIIKLSIRVNPPSCEVENLELLPKEFKKLIPEAYQADRIAIIKHFKDSGEILPGVKIVSDNKRLEIK
jgi:hypothetical protein